MEFLRFLEKLRTPFFDFIFSLITHIGEETVFLIVAIIVFWCVSKREGYYILITGLIGTLVNQALKLIFKVPRPWKHPGFNAVESAIAEAGGYSFPSGHTQNVTGTFGSIGRWSSRRSVRIAAVCVIILVAFSRMYLGVHTPYDVVFSLAFGALLVFLLYPVFKTEESFHKYMPYIVIFSSVLSLVHLILVFVLPEENIDAENLASGMKNAATLFGCTLGLVPVYILDRRFVKFETEAKWYAQIIKLVLGLVVVFGIKAGLSAPLVMLFRNEYVARVVRYFIIVMFAGTLWPMTFGWFSRLRIPFLDKLFERKNTK